MARPTADEVMRHVGSKHGKDELFTGQPVLRALVLALATVLVGREDDAGMEGQVSTILEAVLPARVKPAPWLHVLAQEMVRRMFSTEEATTPVLAAVGDAAELVRLRVPTDLDGIVRELRRFTCPTEGVTRVEPAE